MTQMRGIATISVVRCNVVDNIKPDGMVASTIHRAACGQCGAGVDNCVVSAKASPDFGSIMLQTRTSSASRT